MWNVELMKGRALALCGRARRFTRVPTCFLQVGSDDSLLRIPMPKPDRLLLAVQEVLFREWDPIASTTTSCVGTSMTPMLGRFVGG